MSLLHAQEYFEELRHEVHGILCLVSDFDALFPGVDDVADPDESELTWQSKIGAARVLKRTAPRFFGDLNSILREHYILRIARLGDPPDTGTPSGRRDNLTIEGMQLRLRQQKRTDPAIEQRAREMLDFIAVYAKPARNRVIAHNDLETRTAGLTVGGASLEKALWLHSELQSYCDEVARKLDLSASQLVGTGEGDAHDLMRALKWAYKLRATCTDADCPFQRYDIRPVRALN
jgi:hypothetical protein